MIHWILAAGFAFSLAACFRLWRTLEDERAETRRVKDLLADIHVTMRQAQEEKRRVAAILESVAEGVAVIDAGQRILVFNPALSRALGLSRDVIGRAYWEVFRAADLNEMIGHVLSARKPLTKEHVPPLSEAVFQVRLSPVFEGREFLGVAAVFYDVTELKRLEKSRVDFVANVSHELKTPLTSILGFVETLKEGAIEDVENRGRFLGIVENHARKLHRLIEDLLYLSSVESGHRELRVESVDLDALARDVVETFEPATRAKNLSVTVDAEPSPFRAGADATAMEEVLTILVDNAVKYNVEKGEIAIRLRQTPDGIAVEVRDTGIGIPETDLPRVFERFYRVDKSRARESGGTGLGLSIAKHLIERHGGRIEARSSGKGAAFTVFIPSVPADARAAE